MQDGDWDEEDQDEGIIYVDQFTISRVHNIKDNGSDILIYCTQKCLNLYPVVLDVTHQTWVSDSEASRTFQLKPIRLLMSLH